MTDITDFSATSITGEEVDLSAYEGKVVLVVNTASKCGFTPQYEGLEALHRERQVVDQCIELIGECRNAEDESARDECQHGQQFSRVHVSSISRPE